jgi:hypothetical protein
VPRAVGQQAARPVVPLGVVQVQLAGERVAPVVVPLEVARVLPAGERVAPVVVLPAAPQEVVPRLASALRPV